MVNRLLLILFLASAHTLLQAEERFDVALAGPAHIEYGKPAWLNLSVSQAQPDLRSIDLTALQEHFFVDTSADVSKQAHSQSWRLRLYPYTTGKHLIPAMFFNGMHSESIAIEVTPAIDPKTAQPMSLSVTHSFAADETVWTRQQLCVLVSIQTQSTFSQFRVQPTPASKPVLHYFSLPVRTLSPQAHLHEQGWAWYIDQAGPTRIVLPPIQFYSDGVATHTFHLTPVELTVSPLPLYVPPTMPVGRVQLVFQDNWLLASTGALAELNLSLIGDGVIPERLPDISATLRSQSGLRLYPAALTNSTQVNRAGLHGRIDYRVPLKMTSPGFTRINDIDLSYFDPHTGKIHRTTIRTPLILSVYPWLALLVLIVIAGILYRVLHRPFKRLVKRWQNYRLFRRALQQVLTCQNAEDLRICLRQFALACGHTSNATLTQSLPGQAHNNDDTALALRAALNEYFYAQQTTQELETLKLRVYRFGRTALRF